MQNFGKTIKPALNPTQNGFRKERGVHDYIFTVKGIINKTGSKGYEEIF